MVSIAQLDNEKQALLYQVDCLKDRYSEANMINQEFLLAISMHSLIGMPWEWRKLSSYGTGIIKSPYVNSCPLLRLASVNISCF